MNVPHIILSAIAGVIIYAILNYFADRKLISKKNSTILFIVLIGLFQLFYVLVYAPQKKLAQFEQQLEIMLQQTHPIYQTIKQQDITTYNRLKDKIIASAQKNGGKPSQQLIDAMQIEMSMLVLQRMKYAPDQNVTDMINIMLEEMQILQTQQNDLCFKFLFPQVEGGIKSTRYFPAELIQRDLNSKNALLIASYGATANYSDNIDAVESDLSTIYIRLSRIYGDNLEMLDQPSSRNTDRQLVCDMSIQFYQQILTFPPERAGPIIRMIFSL